MQRRKQRPQVPQDNLAAKMILHTIVGAIQAQLGGGNIAAGALGGLTSEAVVPLMDKILQQYKIYPGTSEYESLMKLASAAVGAGVGALVSGDAKGAGSGGATALSSIEDNYLKHYEVKTLEKELEECNGNASCRTDKIIKYRGISDKNDDAMRNSSDQATLDQHLIDAEKGRLAMISLDPDIKGVVLDWQNVWPIYVDGTNKQGDTYLLPPGFVPSSDSNENILDVQGTFGGQFKAIFNLNDMVKAKVDVNFGREVVSLNNPPMVEQSYGFSIESKYLGGVGFLRERSALGSTTPLQKDTLTGQRIMGCGYDCVLGNTPFERKGPIWGKDEISLQGGFGNDFVLSVEAPMPAVWGVKVDLNLSAARRKLTMPRGSVFDEPAHNTEHFDSN